MPDDVRLKAELTIVLVFFVTLSIFGMVLVGLAVQDFARARASLSWPVVEGVVLSADENGSVRYAYVADGTSHEGRRKTFFAETFGRPVAVGAPGETVPVFVDPEDGALAVLRPGGSAAMFLGSVAVAGLLVFFGVAGLIRTLMKSQSAGAAGNIGALDAEAA